jgi:hypothetical protein
MLLFLSRNKTFVNSTMNSVQLKTGEYLHGEPCWIADTNNLSGYIYVGF